MNLLAVLSRPSLYIHLVLAKMLLTPKGIAITFKGPTLLCCTHKDSSNAILKEVLAILYCS